MPIRSLQIWEQGKFPIEINANTENLMDMCLNMSDFIQIEREPHLYITQVTYILWQIYCFPVWPLENVIDQLYHLGKNVKIMKWKNEIK